MNLPENLTNPLIVMSNLIGEYIAIASIQCDAGRPIPIHQIALVEPDDLHLRMNGQAPADVR